MKLVTGMQNSQLNMFYFKANKVLQWHFNVIQAATPRERFYIFTNIYVINKIYHYIISKTF